MERFIFDEMVQKMHEFQTLTGGNPAKANVKQADIERLNEWINDYPRRILGYATVAEVFQMCLAEL